MTNIIKKSAPSILFFFLFVSLPLIAEAQTKPRGKPKPKKSVPAAQIKPAVVETPVETPMETSNVKSPEKKNERPEAQINTDADDTNQKTNKKPKTNSRPAAENTDFNPTYFYEFSKPEFLVSQIFIQHDESGKGKISFLKKGLDEMLTDPIQVSATALDRIKNSFSALGFLDSKENYQYEKDYSHLGSIKIKIKKDGRERETKFNYTTNENAKKIADEYRKIGQQFLWIFDINLARENQPLESPRLLDALGALIRRNEISDAEQMIPFLKELGNDERIPLISRNHATNLIKRIEKDGKQNK
jgi:hypothetical protein